MVTPLTDYERMGSPPPTVRCAGGTIEVDTPEGIHVFREASGELIETRRQFRDEHNNLYSLERCECGHPFHDGKCTVVERWSYEYCPECGSFFGIDKEGDAHGGECGCEGFEPRRLGPWDK